jgi:hypothetical protein
MAGTAEKTDPELWDRVKKEVTGSEKGGRKGQWSARKAQLASSEYKKRGGGYKGAKSADNHLAEWTREDWGTKSGRTSRSTGERYLPRKAREKLSDEEYGRTTAKKRRDTAEGKQFSRQPAEVAKKAAGARKPASAASAAKRRPAAKAAPVRKAAAPRAATARRAGPAKPAARKATTGKAPPARGAATARGKAAPAKTGARKPAAGKGAATKSAASRAAAASGSARKSAARKPAAGKRTAASGVGKAPRRAPAARRSTKGGSGR